MKTAIITGASSGIGADAAIKLSTIYDHLFIFGNTHIHELEQVSKTIISNECACDIYLGDLSDYDFVHGAALDIISKASRIDALINNAGISSVGLFTEMSKESWDRIFSVNVDSIYNMCHAVVPHMINQKEGRILNISSVWGISGASCEVAYSATKGAINSFSKALAKELAPSNISVNAIAFGAVDTTMNGHLTNEDIDLLNADIPFGRMATTSEAAQCIQKVLEMPNYLTGEIIKFDGAWI